MSDFVKRFIPIVTDLDYGKKDFPRNILMTLEDRFTKEIVDCEKFEAKNYQHFVETLKQFMDDMSKLFND